MRIKILALVVAGTMLLTGVAPAFAAEPGNTVLPAEQVEGIGIADEVSQVENDMKAPDTSLTETWGEEAEDVSAEESAGATKWAKKISVTLKKTGNYCFLVTNCAGQIVNGQILSGKEVKYSGSTYKKTQKRFSMGGYFEKGTYTLCLSYANAKYSYYATDRKSGKCGKNVSYKLKKTKTTKVDEGWCITYNDQYTLELTGSGATYEYNDITQPWLYALDWNNYIENSKDGKQQRRHEVISAIRIGEGITRIGEHMFYWSGSAGAFDMNYRISISLPSTLRTIGKEAFAGMIPAKGTLTIPDNVEKIDTNALVGIEAESIKIGPKAKLVYTDGNIGGYQTKKITVDSKNPYIKSVDGVLFSKNGKTLISFPAGMKKDEYTVPSGTTTILTRAFHLHSFKKLTLPKTVTTMQSRAFASANVEELHILGKLKKLDTPLTPFYGSESGASYGGIFFYGDAPAGTLAAEYVKANIYYPAGNKTWTAALRKQWTRESVYSAITLYPWKKGTKLSNPITAQNITLSAKKTSQTIPAGAVAKGGTALTFTSSSDKVTVDNWGNHLIYIAEGFKGKATVTIKTAGNTAYKAATKKITVTVK